MARNVIKLAFSSFILIYLQQISLGNNETVEDERIERRMREFSELCPSTDTCYSNVSSTEYYSFLGTTECCSPCRCDSDCRFDCCPDIHVNLKSEKELYESKEVQCVDAQYRIHSRLVENGPSFEMVSRCPFRLKDDDIAAKCAREYHDMTLDGPLGHVLPVFGNVTGLIYKNIFCASCHGVNSSYLSYGQLKYSCKNYPRKITYIHDFSTIQNEDVNDDGCNFVFEPPTGPEGYPWLLKTCNRNIISRCNVTGKWISYDGYLEEACLSYTSIYDYSFKNVHCFLCNGFTKDDILHACKFWDFYQPVVERTSFITLLDWNKVEEVNELPDQSNSNDQCVQDELLDTLKREQWPLHCTRGMVEIDKMCLPPINVTNVTTSSLLIDINIILEPVNDLHNGDNFKLNDLMSMLLGDSERRMSMLISRDAVIHTIKGTLQFKTDIKRTSTDKEAVFMWHEVQSVTIQTQIVIDNPDNELVTVVLDFALGFTNISKFSNDFKAKFNHIDHVDEYERLSDSICWIHPNRPEYQLCPERSSVRNGDLNFEFVQKQYELSSNSYKKISIEPEPFCPRVALPKHIYFNCKKYKYTSKLHAKLFMSKLLSENETHMFFCHEDYFRHLSKLESEIDMINENESYDDNGPSLAFVTIACLSVSLISLSLTLAVYAVYPVLRSLPGLINMALVTSLIIFQFISIVRTIAYIDLSWLCSLFGVLTHFSFILSFSWMFVCTFHMFKVFAHIRNRSVDRNEFRRFASYCIFTTGIALILVLLTIVVSLVRSNGSDVGYGGRSCYIKEPVLIIVMVALPIALVIFLNIAMFCVVIYKIQKHPTLASSNPKERQNIIIFAKLSTITGMTWIFGFIYIFTQIQTFAYIYIILNAGQGVFIMLSFVCNRRIFNMICRKSVRTTLTKQTTSTTDI